MMMLGEGGGGHHVRNPTVQVPPWNLYDDPTGAVNYSLPVSGVTSSSGCDASPYLFAAAMRRYLPSNEEESIAAAIAAVEAEEEAADVDAYSSDEFRMYEFKVRRCARGRSHDWTECPFAHPGEKARRRDPRKYHYSGTACPDFRKGHCKRGDACEFAHGVFECWLHPARYRTQPCKDGTACRRRVCFFAHTQEQLRVLPNQQQSSPKSPTSAGAAESYDGSPMRHQAAMEALISKSLMSSSPTSTLVSPPVSPTSESPPMSPSGVSGIRSWPPVGSSVLASLRQLQLSKVKSAPSSWGFGLCNSAGFGSPRGSGVGGAGVSFRGGFSSLPSTPTKTTSAIAAGAGNGSGWLEGLERGEEEPVERVESGRALRAKMFERLSKETGLDKAETGPVMPGPDVGWVSELVK